MNRSKNLAEVMNLSYKTKCEYCLQVKNSQKISQVSSLSPILINNYESLRELIIVTLNNINTMNTIKILPNVEHSNYFKQTLELRRQILDWLVIVSNKTCQSDKTYFMTQQILDEILKIYDFKVSSQELQLVAITSLFIASKFYETKPLKIKHFVKKIAHGLFSKEEIIATELVILKRLKFKLPKVEFEDFIGLNLASLFPGQENQFCIFKNVIFMVFSSTYKSLLTDYELLMTKPRLLWYTSLLYFSISTVISNLKYLHNFSKKKFNQLIRRYKLNNETFERAVKEIENKVYLCWEEEKEYYPYLSQEFMCK